MAWTVEKLSPVTTGIHIDMRRNDDWEQWGLITADRHLDSPYSNQELQRYHLDQAKECGAFVLDFGDLFDAMQGKSDRRSNKKELRPELMFDADLDEPKSYLNRLVDYAAEFFEPYAQNMALISDGNHETSVDNKLEYNLIDGLMYKFSVMGSPVTRGGYRGWIRFLFEDTTYRTSRNGYWIHGYGGGGPVTKDVIQSNRKAAYLANADYVFSGHTHDQWQFPIERTRLLNSGKEVWDRQYHIKVPSYKDEFFNRSGGFHHETGKPPKPVGAWWVRFYWSNRRQEVVANFVEADI